MCMVHNCLLMALSAKEGVPGVVSIISDSLLTLSVHVREGYSSHPFCMSVCHALILENEN